MRERIKSKADRAGMSMNEAIVFCLETWFPAPKTLDQKIGELASMVAALKQGNDLGAQVDALVDEIDTTLREVADGKVKASGTFRDRVSRRIEEWNEDEMERANDEAHDPFDDANYADPNRTRTQGNWDPSSPDWDPFTDEPLPGSPDKTD
ncbi:hypothetical protein X731_16280 [Mesorhizobium sp. L2C054A000]|nr:hypothetical protein X731_16280 [Mesorhizobium sp. L2C054A000]